MGNRKPEESGTPFPVFGVRRMKSLKVVPG